MTGAGRSLILDEVQHLCHTRSRDRAVVLDAIKAFSTTSQINVICAGTPAVEREFHSDPQIERRFSVTRFIPWTAGPALQRFVGTYERARPLKIAVSFVADRHDSRAAGRNWRHYA
jgi:hypothetical protein